MNTYTIYLGAAPIACVADTNAAYACFEAAKTLAEYTGKEATLVWDETGEEIACFTYEEEEQETSSCLHCPWCWIAEGEEYPRCHFEGAVAPCEEEDEYYEYDDEDLELGFDPYCGCYTDDC